jgi:hypothetical protein
MVSYVWARYIARSQRDLRTGRYYCKNIVVYKKYNNKRNIKVEGPNRGLNKGKNILYIEA